ncbi:hypothetical protein E2P81_ATG07542 [Venturia nashicola]|nr:hypothetical protein E2P81_ATG07542 [Venturia nashicola]
MEKLKRQPNANGSVFDSQQMGLRMLSTVLRARFHKDYSLNFQQSNMSSNIDPRDLRMLLTGAEGNSRQSADVSIGTCYKHNTSHTHIIPVYKSLSGYVSIQQVLLISSISQRSVRKTYTKCKTYLKIQHGIVANAQP